MTRTSDDPCVANDRSENPLRLDVAAACQRFLCSAVTVILLAGFVAEAQADTSCRGGQSFESWLTEFRREAGGHGVSQQALAALDGVAYDARVLRQDRGQPTL